MKLTPLFYCFLSVAGIVVGLPTGAQAGQAVNGFRWANFAGLPGGIGHADGAGAAAHFNYPQGVALDGSNYAYVADTDNHTIRKISPTGAVTTLAGSPGQWGSADGIGTRARFFLPVATAVDAGGNVYVADNFTIRKITAAGVVSTLAGAPGKNGTTDGMGGAARFGNPVGVAVDAVGNVYVADLAAYTIRKITPDGQVSTLAGNPGQYGYVDGVGSAARFRGPMGLAVDTNGNLSVTDAGNGAVRKITPTGVVSTLTDTAGASLGFNSPDSVAIDRSGNIFVDDFGSSNVRKIWKITPGGIQTTLSSNVALPGPRGLGVDGSGNVYMADSDYHVIRTITPGGIVSILAGTQPNAGWVDATGSAARLWAPNAVATDSGGNVYVADGQNNIIRKITPGGVVSSVPGTHGIFASPTGVAVDATGNLFVVDNGNSVIFKITPGGVASVLAGGQTGSTDGTGSAARFYYPQGIAVDGSGNFYVADTVAQTIRKITPGGVVTTLAGVPLWAGSTDGVGSGARFNSPTSVAVDASGNVFVADSRNHTIRKIAPAGVVSTLAGAAGQAGSVDGVGSAARFNNPEGVAVDANGNVLVADFNNDTIRMITPAGVVTTVGGSAGVEGGADGTGASGLFSGPAGLAVTSAGTIYVADANNNRISVGTPASLPVLSGLAVSGGALNPSFAVNMTNYSASVPNAATAVTVTPTVADNSTTVTVNGAPVASGGASAPINLAVGANTISTVVTAQDGITTQTYTVTLTRLHSLSTWRQAWFPGSTATTGPGADLAAPAGDGVCNFIKFATGLDPTHPGAMPGAITRNGVVLTLTYTPSADAVTSGVTFTVLSSDSLSPNTWARDLVDQGTIGSGGVPVAATVPTGSNGQRFLHLQIAFP